MPFPNNRADALAGQHYKQSITKVLAYTDTDTGLAASYYAVNANQSVVRVKTTGASTDFVVRMPKISESAGQSFLILMTARATSNVTITDNINDSGSLGTLGGADVTLNLASDWIVLYNNGLFWVTVDSNGI